MSPVAADTDHPRPAAAVGGLAGRLTVAVIQFRTPELALRCVDLVRASAPGAEVRLVDTEPGTELERRLSRSHPDALYVPAENRSYSHAVNVGLSGAETEHVALMNADVLVEKRTLRDLVAALDADPDAGAAGPLVRDGVGKLQGLGPVYAQHHRRLARAEATVTAAPAAGSSDGPGAPRRVPPAVPVPWLSGCLEVVRRSDWLALGGYDESFRFFNEDTDFGLRLGEAGRRNLLVATPAVHLGGTSTPAHPAFALEGRRGGLVVGKRHYAPAFYAGQRAFVWLEASLGSVLSPSPGRRAAHAELLRMLRTGDLDATPFGATLDDRPAW